MKFKSRLVKKLKNDGNNANISVKITNLAMELESKLKNKRQSKFEENNKQEIDHKLNNMELIEQKPVFNKKKKSEKIQFSYN